MRARSATVLPILALVALGALAGPTPAGAAQSQWRLQSILNPGHMATDAEIWFAGEVEKRSGGQLKITVYPGASLGFAGPRIMTVVGQGLLEAAQMWGAHTAGDLRINEVMELPGLIPYDLALRKQIAGMLMPYWEKAQIPRGVVPLSVVQVEPRNVYTRVPIRTLADLKGKKIRAQGVVETDFTRAIGASPVTLAWEETYTALQQGVIDGFWVTDSSLFNARLHEVVKYGWDVGLGGATGFLVVNRSAFEGLSPDLQKIVRETAREAGERIWARVDTDIKEYRIRLKKAGMTFSRASSEDMKAMLDEAQGVWRDWIQKGGPVAREMVEKIQATVKGR